MFVSEEDNQAETGPNHGIMNEIGLDDVGPWQRGAHSDARCSMLERAVLFAVADNTLRTYGLESDQRVGSVLNAEAWRPTRRCQATRRVQLLCFDCSA